MLLSYIGTCLCFREAESRTLCPLCRIALLVTPKGENESVMAFFGDFCRPGIPHVCLLSPQRTVAGFAVMEGRPVLASIEYVTACFHVYLVRG